MGPVREQQRNGSAPAETAVTSPPPQPEEIPAMARWRQTAQKIRTHKVVRGGAWVAAATLIWHVSNFAFNSVAARFLGPADFGSLAAVVALLYGASPIMYSVQTVASKLTTSLVESGKLAQVRGLLRFYALRLAFAGLVVGAMVVLFSGALARFLHVESGTPIALLALALTISVPVNVQRGVLQGSMRYRRYATSVGSEAVVKLTAAIVVLVWLWPSVEGAVLTVGIAAVAALIVNGILIRFLPAPRAKVKPIAHPYRYSLLTLASLTLLALMLSADVLAAKRYLDADTAGLYAAVSLAGKIVFFATSALSLVLFPWFSSRTERGLDAKAGLSGGLGLIAGISVVVIAIYAFFPEAVITPLFGAEYNAIDGDLPWMGLAFACYATVYLMATYLLSRASTFGIGVLAVTLVGQLGGLFAFHSSITQIIAVEIAAFGAAALVLTTYAIARGNGAPAPAREGPA